MAEAALKAMMDSLLAQLKTDRQQMQQQLQQSFQTQLREQSQQLQQQMQQQIQQQLSARHITAPDILPTTISADALSALVSHADLPDDDVLYARLLQLAFPLVLTDGNTYLLQECCQQLVARVSSPESSPLRTRTSSQGSHHQCETGRGHIVYHGG